MKRPTKGYSGQEFALFPTMLNVSEPFTSPLGITSSLSHSHEPSIEHSPDHTTAAVSFPSPTQPTQPSPGAEQHILTPHESPLHAVHSHGSAEGSLKLNELTTLVTKLSERLRVLEDDLKKTKLTYSAAVTKLILRVKKLETKSVEQHRKRARVVLSEDDEITARRTVTYRRRSEEKRTRKDKGKSIMTEPEPKKKSKKELEQEDGNQEVCPTQGGILDKILKKSRKLQDYDFQGMSYNDIRPIFEKDEVPEKIKAKKNDTQKEMKEVSKESGAKKKKPLPRKSTRSTVKRQKMEEDAEKEDLKGYLDIVPREEV
ncbi:hypothetical protein Tco_0270184 [Tanacetum coccineum]